MLEELIIQESRKRARKNDDDRDNALSIVSFVLVVLGAQYSQKYRVREVSWDENFHAQKRAFWMLDLKNDRICRDQLRFDTHCFEKLCNVLQINGGLKTTRYVTVKEIVAVPSYSYP